MSLLPASAVVSSGQVMETQGGTALKTPSNAFSKTQEGMNSQIQPATPQLVSQQTSPVSASASAASAPTASPQTGDALKPKLEYAGSSLSDLKARATAITPSSAAESLKNRLDLLNTQFRELGNHLQESAAKNDPMQLLRLQNDIYQLDEELELVSKVVEQATSGIRSLLQTQV